MMLLYSLIDYILMILTWVIFAQAILSWLVAFNVLGNNSDTVRQIYFALDKLTEPVYRPIRRIMPDFGALDLTPMVVLLIVFFVRSTLLPTVFSALMA